MATFKNQQKNRRNGRSQKQQNKINNSTQKRRNLIKNQKKNKSSKIQQNMKQRRQTQRRHRVGGVGFFCSKRDPPDVNSNHTNPYQDPVCLEHKNNMTRIKGILDQKFLQQLNTIKQGAIEASGLAQNMLDENQYSTHKIALMLVKTINRVYFPNDSKELGFLYKLRDKLKELVVGLPHVKVDTSNHAKVQIEKNVRDIIRTHLKNIESEYQEISGINSNTGLMDNGHKETTATKIQRYSDLHTRVKIMVNKLKKSVLHIEGVEQQQIQVALLAEEIDALITITIQPEVFLTAYKLVFLKAYMKKKIGKAIGSFIEVISGLTKKVAYNFDKAFDILLELRLKEGEHGDNPLADMIDLVRKVLPDMIDLVKEVLYKVDVIAKRTCLGNYDTEITNLLKEELDPKLLTPDKQGKVELINMNFEQLVLLLNKSSEEFFKCLAPTNNTLYQERKRVCRNGSRKIYNSEPGSPLNNEYKYIRRTYTK
jgi:hypothetical protein